MWVLIMMILFLPLIVLGWSFVWTTGGVRYDLSFYDMDRGDQPGVTCRRRYRSPGHFFYRLFDLTRYAWPLARVYGLRTISPGFREKIMITTALANNCRH
ncbi:MAG: hypothetical protein AB1724_20155 [Thermodesulfobacteriota bacterium]